MKEVQEKINDILLEKQTKILPENIKKGVSIFGVTGRLEPSSEQIKLFETVGEMQADTTAQKGDLAVVYVDNTIIPNPGDSISTFEPRTTVLLDSVVTEHKNISTGYPFRGQLTVELQPTSCDIHYTSAMTSTYFDVTYESSDGQLYTRTDGGESSYIVLNSITFPDSTDTQILAFFATGSVSFNGLFKYTLQSDGSYAYEIAPSQLSLSSTSQILPGIIGYGSSGVVTGDETMYEKLDFKKYMDYMCGKDMLSVRPLIISQEQYPNVPVSLVDKEITQNYGLTFVKNYIQLNPGENSIYGGYVIPVGTNIYVFTSERNTITVYLFDNSGNLINSIVVDTISSSGSASISNDNFYYNDETDEFHVIVKRSATNAIPNLYHVWYNGAFNSEEIPLNDTDDAFLNLYSYIHANDDYILYSQDGLGLYKYNVTSKETSLISADYTSDGTACTDGKNVYVILSRNSSVKLVTLDMDCNFVREHDFGTGTRSGTGYLANNNGNVYVLHKHDDTGDVYSVSNASTILDTFYVNVGGIKPMYFPDNHILLSMESNYESTQTSTSTETIMIEPKYDNYWHDVGIGSRIYFMENNKYVWYALDGNNMVLRGECVMDKQLVQNNSNPVIPCIVGYNTANPYYVSYFNISSNDYTNTISPTEYNTAIDTSEQILGEGENVNE